MLSSLYSKIYSTTDVDGGNLSLPLPSGSSLLPEVGATAVRANSIKLNPAASATDNYYVGFDIVLERTVSSGKTYTQQKKIVAYQGSTKIAVIEDAWDIGFEPAVGDSYSLILSYPDQRVSINPPMQVLDYVTSKRYGRNLSVEKDILLDTWTSTARKCDSHSDVSLKMTTSVAVTANAVYQLLEGARIVFEGRIRTTETSQYINFTKVIGKITNKWVSWKSYEVGDIIYTSTNKFFRVTSAGSIAVEPTATGGSVTLITSLTLTKLSGTGPATLSLDVTKNPVLKLNDNNEEVSGYSLYDADSIDYWRRLGWDEHSQSWATLHQTNFTVDTSAPMFDNINMMLEHFNGIFSYSQGKYTLALEEIESTYTQITEDDIIGRISFEDSGNKSSYNSVTVSYSDPANNFEGRNISLFSQTYLKQDRNVPKKGNITVTGITNYYNVRLLADSYLKRSRFNATISLTLYPEFITLLPGNVIAINYRRYNWTAKPFRIDTLTINTDGSISIVANEYHESFYALTNMNKTADVGNRSPVSYTPILSPTNLKATNTIDNNELKDGILLTWENRPNLQLSTQIEIYSSDSPTEINTITSINSNQVVFSTAHGLNADSSFVAKTSGNGIIAGTTYFVKTVVNATTVTLSTTLKGPTLVLTNGTGLSISINTYNIVASLSYPTSSYLHTFPNITDDTVKYYKIRYKAEK